MYFQRLSEIRKGLSIMDGRFWGDAGKSGTSCCRYRKIGDREGGIKKPKKYIENELLNIK